MRRAKLLRRRIELEHNATAERVLLGRVADDEPVAKKRGHGLTQPQLREAALIGAERRSFRENNSRQNTARAVVNVS